MFLWGFIAIVCAVLRVYVWFFLMLIKAACQFRVTALGGSGSHDLKSFEGLPALTTAARTKFNPQMEPKAYILISAAFLHTF